MIEALTGSGYLRGGPDQIGTGSHEARAGISRTSSSPDQFLAEFLPFLTS